MVNPNDTSEERTNSYQECVNLSFIKNIYQNLKQSQELTGFYFTLHCADGSHMYSDISYALIKKVSYLFIMIIIIVMYFG